MKILYFAWLKNKTGRSKEIISDKKIKDVDSMYLAGPSDKNIKFIEDKFI